MLLVVDNGSVFTQNLIEFLEDKKIPFEKQTPESMNLDSLERFNSFILSGRRKNEKKTNEVNSKIIKHSIKHEKKLLGICYGAEILALTLGGTIRKTESLQRGNERVRIQKENMICHDDLQVFESHNFEISTLPCTLISVGESDNCKHEIIQYKQRPIFGTQFHPEMSNDGHNLIDKFCSL